jgi:hypothetical protein
MRLEGTSGTARRLVAFAALLTALAVVAAAATVGRAANTNPISATFTVLNDVSATVPGQPSPGGNIGYALAGQNTSTSVVNHFVFSETIGSKGKVVYLDFHGVSCSGLGTDTVSCQLKQLGAGATFDVTALFQTDANATPGSNIVNHVVASFDSQTPNTKNSRTTDTFAPCDGVTSPSTTSPCDVTRTYAGNADGSLAESLALQNNVLNAGGSQTSNITLPPGFLNGFNFVGASLENFSGTQAPLPTNCPNCQPFRTKITIPTAAIFGTGGPFRNAASQTAPYTASFTIQVPPNFKPLGVWHSESNDGSGGAYLQACDTNATPIFPTTGTTAGLCSLPITTQKKGNAVFVTYTFIGVVNGSNYGG